MTDEEKRTVVDDFVRFLKEYGIIGLAIAVVIGNATNDFVNALVDDVIMPFVEVVLPGENWRTVTTMVGRVELQTGHLLGATLDFVIVAFVIYLFVRFALKKEDVTKA